ncbi:excalibur calcium-binding domain-containing protein [Candidatus Saccharibacteria bacterium]|nr:excalibur calcium-binding domain-containing protein [Candidatus Saccharibacteria bacterium]
MSEHKLKQARKDSPEPVVVSSDSTARVLAERDKNANPGPFLRAAVWLLARFPLTRNRYQNWTAGRRLLVGWLLWIVVLPIIPLVAIIIWYVHDPEGFKKSPWAKALVGVFILWLGAFGFIATSPAQLDQNGKYSPVQTAPNGEVSGTATAANTVTDKAAREKVASKTESAPTNGQQFANCTEAFNSGVFNIKRSDPSYQPKLDRDNDGIACEK